MTEPTIDNPEPDPAAVTPEPESQPTPDDDAPPVAKADREAKLRKRAQEAEAERDQLRELVTGLRAAEVERRLSDVLTNPADIWHAATIDDLLDEDGSISADRLDGITATIRERHANWMKPKPLPSNQRTAGPLSVARHSESEDRWGGAFAPKPVR